MVVPLQEIVFVIIGSVVLSLVILAAIWPWTREVRRLARISAACTIGILVWNGALNVTNAGRLNVDSSIVGLSVQDVGSGVLAFVVVLIALALGDRGQPVGRLFGVSAMVGIVTIVVDRFA